jgi:large subunit ribosomal protein L10
MARPDKTAAVAELANEFRTSEGAVLTDYRGLTVKQLQELRRVLGDNASYAVVKNTLTKIAAQDAGIAGFDDLLVGPTAIAFIKGDAVVVAKGLRDFARANAPLVIKGGILDGKTLSVAEIGRFADLESREVLLGKLAGAMLASLQNAVSLFNAPVAQVARLAAALQAKAESDPSVLAGGAGEPPAEPAAAVAEPDAASAAVESEASSVEPEATTTEPEAASAASEPEATTVEPEAELAVYEPETTTTEAVPEAASAVPEPAAETVEPEAELAAPEPEAAIADPDPEAAPDAPEPTAPADPSDTAAAPSDDPTDG